MFDDDNAPSIDELFKIITIDRDRKVKMNIQLRDTDGDEVPIRESIEKLTEFVSDKLKDEGANVCKQQIMPLMAQAVVGGMVKQMGTGPAAWMLSQPHIRSALVHMMITSFYLFKWIQKKKIKIHTTEVGVTDEDIAMHDRLGRASDASVMVSATGGDPKEMVREMLKRGDLKQEDLQHLGFDNMETEDQKDEAN